MSPPDAKALVRLLAMVAGAVAAAAAPALAQGAASSRPFRGLFSGTSGAPARQSLNFTVNLAEAYDDDVLAEGGPTLSPTSQPSSGYYSMLMAGADYARQGRRVQVGLNASSTLRYYSQLKTVRNTSSSIGAGISTTLPGRTTWLLNQTVSYSPSYLYGLFPGLSTAAPGELPTTSAPNYAVNDVASYSYGTSTTLNHGLTRRGSLSVSGDLVLTNFIHEAPGRHDMKSYGARAGFSHSFKRNTAAKVGYRFRGGDSGFGLGTSTVEHGVEIGIQTARALSATRKATFMIALGPSTVNVPAAAIGAAPGQEALRDRRLYRVAGSAGAGYQFGRTWVARATYTRGLEYIPGLTAPVLTGGVSSSVDGLLSRRLDFDASAGYSNGSSALRNASTYTTYTGDLRLRFALTRTWAVYGEYLYYFYDFRGTTQLLPGLPPVLERNGARVGLTLWLPVFKR